MTRAMVLRCAVTVLSASALVVAPHLVAPAVASTGDAVDARARVVEVVAADPDRVGTWRPGAGRRAVIGSVRYTAAAHAYAAATRADAIAVGEAALEAAEAVQELQAAVDVRTSSALERAVVRMERLVSSDEPSERAEADVLADLRVAHRITEAAAELFRRSHQVEVAAQATDVEEDFDVPTGLRAPEDLEPIGSDPEDAGPLDDEGPDAVPAAPGAGTEDDDAARSEAGDREATPGGGRGQQPPDGPEVERPRAPSPGGGATEPSEPTAPEAPAAPEAPEPTGPADEDVALPEPDEDVTEGDLALEEESPAEARPDLDALPEELVAGITDLEEKVAGLAAVLGIDPTVDLYVPTLVLDLDEPVDDSVGLFERVAFQGSAVGPWDNGRVPLDQLCAPSFAPGALLRCDAAAALELLNEEFREHFGEDMGIVSAYRSLDQQVRVRAAKGWLAAPPGTSKHGLGVAVDLADFGGLGQFDNPRHVWMRQHGPRYGWEHPRIMRPGGGGPPEPWHFEFTGSLGTGTGTGAGLVAPAVVDGGPAASDGTGVLRDAATGRP